MQHEWLLDLDELEVKTMSKNTLEKEIRKAVQENTQTLGIFLSYYTRIDGAIAENVQLGGSVAFDNDLSGSFILDFDKVFHNACLNIHEQEKDKLKIEFRVLPGDAKINLTGPFWPERMTDDI
jgi:hypothetical protein